MKPTGVIKYIKEILLNLSRRRPLSYRNLSKLVFNIPKAGVDWVYIFLTFVGRVWEDNFFNFFFDAINV